MNTKRVLKLNSKDTKDGPIIYWMNREMRVRDNWSLLYAKSLADEQKAPVVVVYTLVPGFLGGRNRQLAFKISALKQIKQDLAEKNISFFVLVDADGKQSGKHIAEFTKNISAGAVITDLYPLRISRSWSDYVRKNIACSFFGVDAHNIIPVWITSDKREYGAYTIRPKIFRLLPEFLDTFPEMTSSTYAFTEKIKGDDFESLLSKKELEESLQSISWAPPGEEAAHGALKRFLKDGIHRYGAIRNDPNEDGQSNLSPYLHYGMIAPQRVALETTKVAGKDITHILHHIKNKAKIEDDKKPTLIDHAGAFLEELIVRRELSDNFCFYEKKYDSTECFADWAKKSLEKAAKDTREYVYTKKQLEEAKTHDSLWNAAQTQMIQTGKMHGYMRMYWAKKILEWTHSPEEALAIAIYLNDTYELDGRDPNGYAGIAWSIGGVHDRAWFPRPIFGTIRYMSRGGCEGKFDVQKYITTWVQ
ncbi:MAG: deoxyribodipyrimidine photo-lyase [Candidatus Pacebacteria bacterium]|jgi:deoxyribodipyrimidine photo-lyase|nr:deoxyribodipyrimidine photo-lyase [Candidatus Paceibacterota bacterium]